MSSSPAHLRTCAPAQIEPRAEERFRMKLSLSTRVGEKFSNKREASLSLDQLADIAVQSGYSAICMRASHRSRNSRPMCAPTPARSTGDHQAWAARSTWWANTSTAWPSSRWCTCPTIQNLDPGDRITNAREPLRKQVNATGSDEMANFVSIQFSLINEKLSAPAASGFLRPHIAILNPPNLASPVAASSAAGETAYTACGSSTFHSAGLGHWS